MLPLDFNQIIILVVVFVAAAIDLRTKKIYNVITFPASAVGIISNAVSGGLHGALWAVAGWFLGAAIMIFPHPKNKMHMGDAKLMATIGAFLGPTDLLICFLYFCIIYGVVATVRVMRVLPWKFFFNFFRHGFGGHFDAEPMMETMKSKIALAPAIAVGTLLGILLKNQTLFFLGFGG